MKPLFFKISLFVLITSTFLSCEKELFLEAVVIDTQSSLPIADALVKIDERSFLTNKEGRITARPLESGKEYRIRVEHSNYASISRFFTPARVDSTRALVLPLMKRGEKQTFNTTDSIRIDFARNTGTVLIPPVDWFVIQNDKRLPYKGPVSVQLTYFNPNTPADMAAAPAPLFAENQTNRFPLQSYGMLEIYASDAQGNQLDIGERDQINIALPDFGERQEATGLFNVNPRGFWTQVGTLTFDESTNTLQGSVSSISDAWNADEPCADELVCVSIKFENPDGTPASIFFYYRGLTYQTNWESGSSDAQGIAELYVCPGQVFQLFNLIPCCGGQPVTDPSYHFCCVQNGISVIATIDLSGVTLTPPCTDLGVITL